MMNVAFLAEGGVKFGFGHLARCLALAQAFRNYRDIKVKFLVHGDETALDFLRKHSTEAVKIDWRQSKEEIIRKTGDWRIMVIDSYHVPASFYRSIYALRERPYLVAIDDYDRLDYQVDLVIKPLPLDVNEKKVGGTGSRHCLSGSKYVILRKDFWRRFRKVGTNKIKKLLVTLGGQDIHNLTPRVVDLLNYKFPQWEKYVIAGQGFLNIRKIKARQAEKIRVFYGVTAEKMCRLMVECDAAVSAGGQTLNELAATGTPAVVLGTAYNQIKNIKSFERIGFIEYAGWWRDRKLMPRLEKALKKIDDIKLLEKRRAIGRRAVDGQGACRLARQILKLEELSN